MKNKVFFTKKLLSWFEKNKRNFKWRKKGATPYEVLIAEIMLQKTDAKKVETVYPQFLKKFPSIKVLAKANTNELERVLVPIGLYRNRAKNLKKIANILLEQFGGKIPKERALLLMLPGIGNYIANAFLCFAYSCNVPLVDTNTARITSRFFGFEIKGRARTDKLLWKKMEKLVPEKKPKEFNLALLDFGSLVCSAKNPKCIVCPINAQCNYFKAL